MVFQFNLLLFVNDEIHRISLLLLHLLDLMSAILLHCLEFRLYFENFLLVVFRRSTSFLPPHIDDGFHVLSFLVLDLFQLDAATNLTAICQ